MIGLRASGLGVDFWVVLPSERNRVLALPTLLRGARSVLQGSVTVGHLLELNLQVTVRHGLSRREGFGLYWIELVIGTRIEEEVVDGEKGRSIRSGILDILPRDASGG